MKIAISAESTADLTPEILNKFDIKIIPLFVRLGDDEYLDGEIECQKIFDYVKSSKKLPKTSAPNEQNYIDYFNNILKDYDAVIHFSISKELSSSYDHAKSAENAMKNVYVIDSRSLSTGIALQCIYARELAEIETPITEILEKVQARISKVQVSFVLNELQYLYKGGRCNSLQYIGSNLLKIKPQIVVKDGMMKSAKKFIGSTDGSYMKYVRATLDEFNTPDYNYIFITYTTCKPEILEQIKETLKVRGFKNIFITTAGATITSYCGENCLGILYYNG